MGPRVRIEGRGDVGKNERVDRVERGRKRVVARVKRVGRVERVRVDS